MISMYRVLVVDDDRLARKGIISMMPWEKYGMTVVGEAQNGEKALEFLEGTPVDILFVDLDMPVVNGISLMKQSRELYPNLIFVVLTFHEDFHYVQTVLRMGAIDYISKLEMESADCDELLKGISEKVKTKMKLHNIKTDNYNHKDYESELGEVNGRQTFNEKEWEYVVGKWREMYWLYDDITYEELCNRTKEMNVSIWRVSQVVLHLTSEAEKNISAVEKSVPEYRNLDEFFQWLTIFRQALYKKVSGEVNLDKMQLCIMKAVIFVKEHLGEKLHVEEIAQLVNLSRSYFSINFKKYTGMSFNEFVRQERIKAAQILLIENDALIADVSQDIGYEDVNYFIRIFCEVTGMTPGEYRKQNSKK